jgi:hypothetical protein
LFTVSWRRLRQPWKVRAVPGAFVRGEGTRLSLAADCGDSRKSESLELGGRGQAFYCHAASSMNSGWSEIEKCKTDVSLEHT